MGVGEQGQLHACCVCYTYVYVRTYKVTVLAKVAWCNMHEAVLILAHSLFIEKTLSGSPDVEMNCHEMEMCFLLCAGPLDLSVVPDCGIGVLTVKMPPHYVSHHGACKLTSNVQRAICVIQHRCLVFVQIHN